MEQHRAGVSIVLAITAGKSRWVLKNSTVSPDGQAGKNI
jgi:hypothetical protein